MTDLAIVPFFIGPKVTLSHACANRMETEEADGIKASVGIATVSEFLPAGRYFVFGHGGFVYMLGKQSLAICLPQTFEGWSSGIIWRIWGQDPPAAEVFLAQVRLSRA